MRRVIILGYDVLSFSLLTLDQICLVIVSWLGNGLTALCLGLMILAYDLAYQVLGNPCRFVVCTNDARLSSPWKYLNSLRSQQIMLAYQPGTS